MIDPFGAMLPSRKILNSCYLCGQVEQLHVFHCPKDPSIRAKWFAFCNIGNEYHSSMQTLRLCEKHFKEEEICRKNTPNGRTKLKKLVEPSRNRECLRKGGGDSQICEICAGSGLLKSQRSYSSSKISYFSFPKDPALREKWLKFCELEEEELPPVPKLCSLHFHPDEIMKYSPFKWGLATGAIPIIYDVENIAHCGNNSGVEQSFESAGLTGHDHNIVIEPPVLVNGSSVEDDIEFVDCSIESPNCSAQDDIEDLIDEIVIDDNTSTKSNSPSPQSRPKRKCNRTLRYLGDVRSSDFKSPKKSKRIYEIATATVYKYRKRSILLQKKVGWLQKRMHIYRQIISDLNKRLLMSEKRAQLTA